MYHKACETCAALNMYHKALSSKTRGK
jgi:hypothetical protein